METAEVFRSNLLLGVNPPTQKDNKLRQPCSVIKNYLPDSNFENISTVLLGDG